MTTTTILMFAFVAALGAAAITTAISTITDTVEAKSCNEIEADEGCHGCAVNGQGFESSDGKCHHHRE